MTESNNTYIESLVIDNDSDVNIDMLCESCRTIYNEINTKEYCMYICDKRRYEL